MHIREFRFTWLIISCIFLNYISPIEQNEVDACDGLNDLLKINLHIPLDIVVESLDELLQNFSMLQIAKKVVHTWYKQWKTLLLHLLFLHFCFIENVISNIIPVNSKTYWDREYFITFKICVSKFYFIKDIDNFQ